MPSPCFLENRHAARHAPPVRRLGPLPLGIALLALGLLLITSRGEGAESSLVRIEISPATIRLTERNPAQQVAVTGTRRDGATVDVTARARFASDSSRGFVVDAAGLAQRSDTADDSGESHLIAAVDGLQARVHVELVGAATEAPASYRHDVAPLLSRAGCNSGACHGNLNGKGGFKLSLRGDDLAFDFRAITHDSLGRRVSVSDPGSSLLLLKATGQVAHEGGPRFGVRSAEANTLVRWIAAGTTDDTAVKSPVVALEIFPAQRIAAAPATTQQLVVTATFADGQRRDVTRLASFDVDDPTRVTITSRGTVVAARPTETVVAVRYLEARAISRLAFLPDRPGFVWRQPPVRNVLDRHVFDKLRSLLIQPGPSASDAVFLRRAYLDAIGRLPTVDEARAFLDSSDPKKRRDLIARLVERPEFADFWALKWADLLRNEEKTMGEKGVWIFQRWLRDQIGADVPLDRFATSLVTATGTTWSSPPSGFYRTNRDPMTAAESFGQVFLGVRLQCARCHNHPFDRWTQDDYYSLAAYFSNVRQKDLANERRDNLDKHEINGDEVVYVDGPAEMLQPRSGKLLPPKPPGGAPPDLSGARDARPALARWLTTANPQFARNLVNRVWFHLLGRGIVEPVDDFRETNPPSNPALLDALTDAFVQSGYRLRPLVALIMSSETYQLDSTPNQTNRDDEANFSHYPIRLIPAEVLADALSEALDVPPSFPNAPRGIAHVQLPGARMGGTLLKAFGKPDRLLTCECERSESTTLAQAFQLINGEQIRGELESSGNRIARLIASRKSPEQGLEELMLAALSRRPTPAESTAFLAHVKKAADPRRAWEDVAWAIVNSKEFLLRH